MNSMRYFQFRKLNIFVPLVLIILIFTIIPLIFLSSETSEAASITTVSIILDDKSNILDTKLENSTTFRGNISVFTTSTKVIVVNLRAELTKEHKDWTVVIEPLTLYFDMSDKKGFKVTFNVPDYTIAGHYSATIRGAYHFEGEEGDDSVADQVYVTIPQFNTISFTPSDNTAPYLYLDESDELQYKFFINNEGNIKDTLTLELLNTPELLADDWGISITSPFKLPLRQELNAFMSYEVTLYITPPQIKIPFETTIQFQLSSEEAPDLIENFDLYIYLESGRFILVPGGKTLVILKPLDFPITTISNDEAASFEVEARCFVKDTRISINPVIYSQAASEGRDRFDFDSGQYWSETRIQIKITPEDVYLKVGDKVTFTIELIGRNETERPTNFLERLVLKADGENVVSNQLAFEFIYISDSKKDTEGFFIGSGVQILAVSTVAIASVIVAFVGGTEFGRYSFLCLFIPLFTKIHKDKILDHFTRGRIYEFIRSHPGTHFSELKRELKLTNGGLAYHLFTLEREELVRSFRSGKLKLFYTYEFGIPKEPGRQFSELEAIILQIVDENPGISQSEVGEMILNRNHRTVSHNIKQLSREGYIRLEKDGRVNNCFIDLSQLNRSDTEPAKEADVKKSSIMYRM
ncbi:MAG: hypothetical protein JSV49_12500 [Thermoplasmata archaeon]|nr:MAG: hypothetical protein JSV49_12500 [Thermoplasmata archaeon]